MFDISVQPEFSLLALDVASRLALEFEMHRSRKYKKLTCYILILSLPWLAHVIITVFRQCLHMTSHFLTVALLIAVSIGQLLALHRFREIHSPKSWPSGFGFSARETEVANLVVAGLSNAQIASALFISVSTVKSHVRNIIRKANVNSRWELIRFIFPSTAQFSLKDDSRISGSY